MVCIKACAKKMPKKTCPKPTSPEDSERTESDQQQPAPPRRAPTKRRWRPGTVALQEIGKYQKSSDLLIPKAPFARVVREVMDNFYCSSTGRFYRARAQGRVITRWSAQALLAIQSAAEEYLVGLMHDGLCAAIHAKRVTLTDKDLRLVRRFRNNSDAFNMDPNLP